MFYRNVFNFYTFTIIGANFKLLITLHIEKKKSFLKHVTLYLAQMCKLCTFYDIET